jgi:hypothetical protein
MTTETKTALQIARDEAHAASRALHDAEQEVRREIREATAAVNARWSDRIDALARAKYAAQANEREATLAATVDHPWEGQIVTREVTTYAAYSSKPFGTKTIRGFVRTYRPGVELPLNRRNTWVDIGTVLVFALKKDGTPGKDYELFRVHADWKLEVQS